MAEGLVGGEGFAVDASMIVADAHRQRGVEGALHFLDGLEPGAAALDAEMLVKQGAVPAFDNAV